MISSKRILQIIIFFVLIAMFGANALGQETDIRQLLPEQIMTREMTGAELHRYKFELKKDKFFQVRVEQKGVDVLLKLLDANGNVLATMDSPNGKEGPETLSFAAEKAGGFVLEISGFDEKAEKGIYTIKRESSRTATVVDKRRVEIERLFVEGMTARDTERQGEKAIKKLEEALAGWHELKDEYLIELTAQQVKQLKLAFAKLAFDQGMILFNLQLLESYQSAREKFLAASRLYREGDDKNGEAQALVGVGLTSSNIGEKQKALEYYKQALSLFQAISDKEWEATTLTGIGKVYSDLGEKQKAIEFFNQSLLLLRQVGDKSGETVTLNNIGLVYDDLGEKQKALKFYNQSLWLVRTVGDKLEEAKTLNNIGLVYDDLGEKQKALKFYNQSLLLFRQVGDSRGESVTLNNIGAVYSALGESQKALDYFNQSLPMARAIGYKAQEATTLNNIGKVYSDIGEKQKALDYYMEAFPLMKLMSDKTGEAAILNNIGSIYDSLGDQQKALDYFKNSLQLQRQFNNKQGEAKTLNNLGKIYNDLGEKTKAEEYFTVAFAIFRELDDKSNQAISLFNIGLIYESRGDLENARLYYHKAVSLNTVVKNPTTEIKIDISSKTKSLSESSKVELTEDSIAYKEIQKSRRIYLNTLRESISENSLSTQAKTLTELMLLEWALGNSATSIWYGKQAVSVFKFLEKEVKNGNEKVQNALFHSKENALRELTDILIAEGRIAEAEQVLEMLKEDELFDYLRRDDKVASELRATINLMTSEIEAFKRYEEIADQITRIGKEFEELEKESRKYPVGEFPRQAEMDKLDAQLADARMVFNKFLEGLDAQFRNKETKGRDNRVAQISGTKALLDSLNQPRTVIISTIAGEDRLNLIVTTSKINRAHTVDIKAADLNKLVVEFREAVKNPAVDPRPLGKKLFDVLFPSDLQKDLAGVDADTIVWSLDGTLRYAPVAALWDGKQYLAERYAKAVITLASRDKIDKTPARRKDWTALGVGVSKEFETFPALVAVPEELCRVVNDPQKKADCLKLTKGKKGVMNGVNLSDGEFTFQNFKLNLGRYKVVHIASHFSLKAGNETDSYLLLGGGKTSDERKLTIAAVREQLDNKFVGTELLVLSACNTAMSSGENSSGAEIEGFGALAQIQGAKTVLASLWAVADESTMRLMTEFYDNLENDSKIGKAEALRKAQQKMIQGEYKTSEELQTNRAETFDSSGKSQNQPAFKTDSKTPYAHPYYWSPFVLIGNWK